MLNSIMAITWKHNKQALVAKKYSFNIQLYNLLMYTPIRRILLVNNNLEWGPAFGMSLG